MDEEPPGVQYSFTLGPENGLPPVGEPPPGPVREEFRSGMTFPDTMRFYLKIFGVAYAIAMVMLGASIIMGMLTGPFGGGDIPIFIGIFVILGIIALIGLVPFFFFVTGMRFGIYTSLYKISVENGVVRNRIELEVFKAEDVVEAQIVEGPDKLKFNLKNVVVGQPYGKRHVKVRVRKMPNAILFRKDGKDILASIDVDDPERFVKALGCPVVSEITLP